MSEKNLTLMPETIASRILLIRGQKVIIDRDLANLYNVTTRRLNEQVKRNFERFPADFAFKLTKTEKAEVVANCDHLSQHTNLPIVVLISLEHWQLASDIQSL